MAIKRRGRSFEVDYYYAGHRIRKAGFRTITEARNYLIMRKNEILYRKHPMPRRKAVSFIELAKRYIAEYSRLHKAPKTFETDVSLIKSLMGFFGDFLIRDITLEVMDRYKNERVNAPSTRGGLLSRTTINREVGLLRNMLNKAVDWQLLEYNPILRVKMFKEEPREKILTIKELQAVVDQAKSPLKEILITALNTGMRRSEALGLKWDHVNLDSSYIILTKTKTNKQRLIPLNPVMKETLSQLFLRRAGNVYVFTNPHTGKPFQEIKTAWKTVLRKCNIQDFRFHDLRHCFASYSLSQSGGNLFDLKEILGHEKIATTSRYYKSVLEGKQRLVNGFQIGAKPGIVEDIKKINRLKA